MVPASVLLAQIASFFVYVPAALSKPDRAEACVGKQQQGGEFAAFLGKGATPPPEACRIAPRSNRNGETLQFNLGTMCFWLWFR